MVPRDFRTLSARRVARARTLADRYPASAEALRFCAAVAEFQSDMVADVGDRESLLAFREPLVQLIRGCGPPPLQRLARELDDATYRRALDAYLKRRDTTSPQSLFARVVLQPYAAATDLSGARHPANACPDCGHAPQVGALRSAGDGTELALVCSLCPREWPFRTGTCSHCGEDSPERFAYYTAPGFEHLRVQACDACRTYLHTVDLSAEPAAVPEIDELAALPLDVWAVERDYHKAQPNLAGI